MAKPHVPYEGPIVSRKEAQERGEKRYFTGVPCIHGHVDRRNTANRICSACANARSAIDQKEHPGKRVRLKRAWLERKAGRPRPSICEICRERNRQRKNHSEEFRLLHFDHCHKTGKFRGWICNRCNNVLGWVNDDTALLKKMVKYLERANGRTISKAAAKSPQIELRLTR